MGPCCPIHTLTAALAVAADAGAAVVSVVSVEPCGTCPVVFSSDAGENFPITIPTNVSLAGDDAGCATIAFDSPGAGPAVSLSGQSSIERFTIEPALPGASFVGIACDAGHAYARVTGCALYGGGANNLPGVDTPSDYSCLLDLEDSSIQGFGIGVQIYWPAGAQMAPLSNCDITENNVGLELWTPPGATPTLQATSTWVHHNTSNQIEVNATPDGGSWTLTGACTTPLVVSGYTHDNGIWAMTSYSTIIIIGDVQFSDGGPVQGVDYDCQNHVCGSQQVTVDAPCDGGFDGG